MNFSKLDTVEMKKQFNRVKQLANQTVGRAEKTEVLSDDLLQIERRLESVRLVSHNVHKKMALCLQGHMGTDVDKRHKKLPLTGLSLALQDGGSQLGEETMIGKMMEMCADAENKLAQEQSQLEVQLEKEVLDPLNQLAEVDIPNILKQRKQLAKLVLDYDSAKARHQQAIKAAQAASNNPSMFSKADLLREEVDEAHNKVEICKDQLSADLYNFSSKEGDYACYYVMLLEAQAEHHRRSLAFIENILPTIKSQQESCTEMPAFGTPLEEHLKRSNREIALPLEACVMMLLDSGMKEEGLFRIAAGASKLKKLKAALDCSTSQLVDFCSDPHAVAGALKSYLRELPEPLMTYDLYNEWIQATTYADPDQRLQALWTVCDRLPEANKANLRYLVKFLAKLAQDSDINKMTPNNIAIVLGPNLLWPKTEGTLAEMAAATSVLVAAIIEPIIQHADWFFPDAVEFNVSGMFVAHQSGYPSTPEPELATIDRKRPGSQGAPDSETPRKDSPTSKHPEHMHRRATPLNKKQHSSPAFLPPLPPVEAGMPSVFEASPLSPTGGSEAGQAAAVVPQTQQLLDQQQFAEDSSTVAREPASTPPALRNGPGGPGTPTQLTVGTPMAASKGPSPHMIRRGTKKQAPAPPKTSPVPSPSTPHTSKVTPGPTTPTQTGPPVAIPRRLSSSQMAIQAPSHPPPQPPQITTEPEASPPRTPTPPDTPLLDATQTPPLSSFQSGSQPRPRPVPRPRPRPSMPPPPQPPGESANGVCGSASKIITEEDVALKGSGQDLVPKQAVDQPTDTPPNPDNHMESTIL